MWQREEIANSDWPRKDLKMRKLRRTCQMHEAFFCQLLKSDGHDQNTELVVWYLNSECSGDLNTHHLNTGNIWATSTEQSHLCSYDGLLKMWISLVSMGYQTDLWNFNICNILRKIFRNLSSQLQQNIFFWEFLRFSEKFVGSKVSDFCQKISQNSDFCW